MENPQALWTTLHRLEQQNRAVAQVEIDEIFGFCVFNEHSVGLEEWSVETYRGWRSSQSFGPQCSAKLRLFDYRTVSKSVDVRLGSFGEMLTSCLMYCAISCLIISRKPSVVHKYLAFSMLNLAMASWAIEIRVRFSEIQTLICQLSIPTSIASCCMSSLCRNLALGALSPCPFRLAHHVGGLDLRWVSTSAYNCYVSG